MATIRAAVGEGLLAKADRLFRHDDAGVFAELLQNSRRAGATKVVVALVSQNAPQPISKIVFEDVGFAFSISLTVSSIAISPPKGWVISLPTFWGSYTHIVTHTNVWLGWDCNGPPGSQNQLTHCK